MRLADFQFDLLDQVIINGRCPRYSGQRTYGFWVDNQFFEISLERGILAVFKDMDVYLIKNVSSYPIKNVSSDMEEEHIRLLFETLDAVEGCIVTKSPYYVGRWHFTSDEGLHIQYRSIRDLKYIQDMGYTIVAVVCPKVLPMQ